jgi:nucleotide-binding universal stress UspA family protein
MGAGGWNGSKPAHHGNTARYVLRHASCPVLLIMGAQNVAARPFSMKHILVPIDFSANSPRVLHYAVSLAEQFRSRLHLLHATHGYYPMPGFGPAEVISSSARTRSDAAGQLAGLATREVPNDIPADITVREGDPAGEIVGAAEDFEADLIVLSTHGYTGLRHVWFGSVAESVVRHARCPLFIIREHNHLSSS